MIWLAETDPSDEYKLLVCVPSGSRLYVLVVGPGGVELSGPGIADMTVTPSNGEPLPYRTLTRTGGRTDVVYLGQFGDPPYSPVPLDVRLAINEVEVFAAVAVPVRTEPA